MGDSANSKSNSFRYDVLNCPTCKHELDAATPVDGEEDIKPAVGDFSICFYCGEILKFQEELKLRMASQEDLEELIDDSIESYDDLIGYQELIRNRNK